MRVTEIRIDRTKSLGNYENLKLGYTAVIEESEDVLAATDRLKMILDWELNYEERTEKYEAYKKQLENGNTNGRTEAVQNWIARYESQAEAINALPRNGRCV